MLGQPTAAARALGRTFSRAVAAFAATAASPPRISGPRTSPPARRTVRHFA